MSTFRMWEVFAKADDGPFYKDQGEWMLKSFIPNIRRVVKEYNIKYDGHTIVNQDDELADRVWAAAKDFFVSTGVYNQDTHRVMQFTEREPSARSTRFSTRSARSTSSAPATTSAGSASAR